MRHILKTIICASFALLTAACNNQPAQNIEMAEGEGVLALNLDFGSRSDIDATTPFELKIYRYASDNNKELVRKYTALADIPQYIWLISDNYCVQAKVGNKEFASFTDKYYTGSSDFTITSGNVANVEVECFMENIPVLVSYDATIAQYFTKEFYTYVSATNSFDIDNVTNGKAPALKYTESKEGYFTLPNNVTNLSWYFYGNNGTETMTLSGVIENPEPRKLYNLKFKYSKGAPGGLIITATVDIEPEYRQENVPFSPDPTVKGVGFDAKATQNYTGGSRTYNISALDTISKIEVSFGNQTFNLIDSTYDYFTVTKLSAKDYTVEINEQFFTQMYGGTQTFIFNVKDASGGIGHLECVYNIAGILPLNSYDLWFGVADFSAMSFDSNITIGYRANGGTWSYLPVSAASAANTYNATATNFTAGKSYDYALFANGQQVGLSLSITTPQGAQIPEAGFESWSYGGKHNALCPTANYDNLFWDTGNHALASLNMGELTTNSTDVRSDATGNYSAYMKSTKASIAGIGKFAAGNLFVGRFVNIAGMGGIVEFGREFNFTARPKAIRFWIKNNQGTINEGSYTSGTDLAKIYCCFTDRKFTVNTNSESTFFTPDLNTEGILAAGSWQSTESHSGWTQMEIPIEYKEGVTTKPTILVLTFTCSGYGDYFTGSTDSYMYVDDVELVY